MKKGILSILLSLTLSLSFISCSKTPDIVNNEENKVNKSSSENNNSTSSENNDSSNNQDNLTKKNTENEEIVSIYYYDAKSDKIIYINKTINVTDDIIEILTNELKKSPNADISPSLSNKTTLNSYNLNNENSTITLDFSSNFVTSQNLGSRSESNTLTAICNTFGNYFDVENVIITLDGKPYSSGHISMSEGEPFKVDLNDTVELK